MLLKQAKPLQKMAGKCKFLNKVGEKFKNFKGKIKDVTNGIKKASAKANWENCMISCQNK